MISADFAPNESWDDALTSLITLCLPWSYQEGGGRKKAQGLIQSMFPHTFALLFLSGRGSLSAVLDVLALPKGSEIIVQGFTCEAVVLPILHMGCKPVYADIEKETFSLDIHSLRKRITPATKVLILQHSFGLVPKYRNEVLQLAKEKSIFVIEDLAHGFEPGFWQKQTLSDKQLLLLSFGRSKALSSVFGGAVVTGDRHLEAKLKTFEAGSSFPSRRYIAKLLCYKPITWVAKQTYNFMGFGKFLHYFAKKSGLLVAEISQKEKGGNYDPYLEKKYPNALAKLLIRQLSKYPSMIGQRRVIVDLYREKYPLESRSIPSRYPLLIEKREHTLNDVSRMSIYLGNWYTQPVAPKELNLHSVKYTIGSCPVAEDICKRIINLPTLISTRDAQTILRELHKRQ